jgi:hypothetical protein
MNLNASRLDNLQDYIWGGNTFTPLLGNRALVELFNSVGFEYVYDFENGRLPSLKSDTLNVSRRTFTLRNLNEINNTQRMDDLLEIVFNLDHFNRDPTKNLVEAVNQVNLLIHRDNYSLVVNGDGLYQVVPLTQI